MKFSIPLRAATVALASLFALGTAQPASGQQASDPGVAVFNESLHELRVFVYDSGADESERELLGWVGHDELEFFRVPTDIAADGKYHVAVQEVTPLPQLGVSAEANPVYASSMLTPEPHETVRITVSPEMDLSEVVVR